MHFGCLYYFDILYLNTPRFDILHFVVLKWLCALTILTFYIQLGGLCCRLLFIIFSQIVSIKQLNNLTSDYLPVVFDLLLVWLLASYLELSLPKYYSFDTLCSGFGSLQCYLLRF